MKPPLCVFCMWSETFEYSQNTHAHACTYHTHMHTRTHAHTHTHTTHTHTHTTRTRTHTHTHTHTHLNTVQYFCLCNTNLLQVLHTRSMYCIVYSQPLFCISSSQKSSTGNNFSPICVYTRTYMYSFLFCYSVIVPIHSSILVRSTGLWDLCY